MDSRAVPSLAAVLATVPDCRVARGKRHGLLPTVLLVCVATRRGARAQPASAAWGQDDGPPWLRRRGFTKDDGPRQAARCRLFQRVAYASVEAALRMWAEQVMAQAAGGGGPSTGRRRGAARSAGRPMRTYWPRCASGWGWCRGRRRCRTRPPGSARPTRSRSAWCWRGAWSPPTRC